MRDDLLDAQAAIDWAVSQLNTLERRIEIWIKESSYTISYDLYPQIGKKSINFRSNSTVPAIINAEVGVIINSIRSSLDLLVNVLAVRNGHVSPKDMRFPISRDKSAFEHGKHAGRKEIKRLSATDIAVIESLEPWRGGKNLLLIALHDLDIMRKHIRLIRVGVLPDTIKVSTEMFAEGFRFVSIWPDFKNDTPIAVTGIDAPERDLLLTLTIMLAETGPIGNIPVVVAINQLASLATSIIGLFD